MTSSKIFLYLCLSFIFGIFLSSFFNFSKPILLAILIFAILLISFFWRNKKIAVFGFCLIVLVFGILRHHLAEFKILNSELNKFNNQNEILTLTGIILTEPDTREKSQKLVIGNIEIFQNNSHIDGKVLVSANRYPEYQYGDKLKITGKLETPQELGDFDYPGYLAKDGIYSVIYWPEIELLERENYRDPISIVYAKILKFKNKLRESIYQNLSPPQGSILGAMILGDKRKISEEWKNKLNIAGVRHITAVSGLHVAVLTSILMTFLIGLGFWRQQAFYFTIILITFFIIITGLQSSAIRAGIMGGLFLLAQYLGRMNTSSRATVFAGAVMLAQNPLLLRLDIGFQLSFLAIIGIIYLFPAFKDWLKFIPRENLKDILAMTFSAYLFTLPILIYNFGYFSLVAPITNLLIIPFLYWIILFGFILGVAGIISQSLGWLFSFPVWLLLSYLTKTIDWFTKFPLASLSFRISWIWVIFSYLILFLIIRRLQKEQKLKFLKY